MKYIKNLIIAVVLGVIAIVIFVYSGLFNVAATAKEPEIVRLMLETTRINSIKRAAKDIDAPTLANENQIAIGGKAFDDMCIACHGGPGKQRLVGMLDMNPAAPDLSIAVQNRTAEELFWIIKHGIRMTGMPAWGASHSDQQIWDIVAFLTKLPGMKANTFNNLISNVKDTGHNHLHGSGNEHDKMNKKDATPTHDNSDGHHNDNHQTGTTMQEMMLDQGKPSLVPAPNTEHNHDNHAH